jgi:hypothetical protein
VLDQKGYRASRGLPFTDETAQEELCRGRRLVGFIPMEALQNPVDHKLVVGEQVEVNGVAYTVTAPGVGDGDSANLILAIAVTQQRQQRKLLTKTTKTCKANRRGVFATEDRRLVQPPGYLSLPAGPVSRGPHAGRDYFEGSARRLPSGRPDWQRNLVAPLGKR